MLAFDYVALDSAGKRQSGVLMAQSERAAREELLRRKLAPLKIAATDAAKVKDRVRGGAAPSARLSTRTLALVTRQLATLMTVSTLEESLRTLCLQYEDRATRALLVSLHTRVLEGFRLSDAMARHERAFPTTYRAMVAAGEASGALPAVLERVSDLLERDQEIRAKVTTALVYPALLALTAVLVVIALMTNVVPRVAEQFEGMGQQLPLLTRIVIGVSDAIQTFGLPVAIALLVGLLLGLQALKAPPVRLQFDRALIGLPVMGRVIRNVQGALFARMVSTMLASGLTALDALHVAGATLQNRALRGAAEAMAESVREGGGIAAAARRSGLFPSILVSMAASGEESGRLEAMLSRAADYLERDFSSFVAVTLSLLEPAIIAIMGAVVAVIVLSILLPILQINSLAFS